MIPVGFGMSPLPAYHVKRLQERRETITALVDALESFLAFDIDADLEALEKQSSAAPVSPWTPEMLVNAQTELANMEAQAEAMTKMRDNFPEELAPMFDSMQSMFGAENSLKRQRETVKMIQNALDGKNHGVVCGCGRALMEDGASHYGPLNPAEMFQGTIEECEVKARECGWIVDGMDHTCPECSAKS